jgi:squalene synthase HpnC
MHTGSRPSPFPTPPHHEAARRDPAAWRLAGVPVAGDLASAEAFCRAVARRHYENFTVATRLVPPRLRQHLANVYAFARWADDLGDESATPAEATAALADWRDELDACFAGHPRHPVFIALADTIRGADLDREPFENLITAFEQDQTTSHYQTRDELVEYCRRSADPVGRIVLALEGCRDPALVAMSDSICTGLQLVNFWQDVRRDRLAGRVYLPREDMERFGVDEAMLDESTAGTALRRLLAEEVAWARRCFHAGEPLADAGPAVLRPAIAMFVGGGRAVADAIERAGFDTLSRRPTVGRWTKATLAVRAWWRSLASEGRR